MNNTIKCALLALSLSCVPGKISAQTVIPLPVKEAAPPAEERTVVKDGQTLISGVTEPSISVFLPPEGKRNGTAVIICPGGGMRVLSWGNDLEKMAEFFTARGIAAIGLKYRLYTFQPTRGAKMPEMVDVTGFQRFEKANANPMPTPESAAAERRAYQDCQAAVRTVREHSSEWGVDPAKIVVMGFSAGGGVAIGATVSAAAEEMPDFLVSVYGPALTDVLVPENAPDLLIMTRTDHMNVAAGCLQLFLEWKRAGKNAELHMYGDGYGPFGLPEADDNSTTASWPGNLLSWMKARKLAE